MSPAEMDSTGKITFESTEKRRLSNCSRGSPVYMAFLLLAWSAPQIKIIGPATN